MNESQNSRRITINIALGAVTGIAAQLVLAVLVAIVVGQVLSETWGSLAGGTIAALVGLLLAFPLMRTLWMVATRIEALYLGHVAEPLPTRWHFLLAGFVDYLNTVIERVNGITTMRQGLIDQTREAASQQERNRLARDLHDSIKQQIFGISMSAAAIEARWDSDPDGARQSLADVQENARAAMIEMTALLQQLSPAPLEKVGLVQALRDQCEALAYRTGAQVEAEFGPLPDDERLPPGTGVSLFRVVQEALSNVAQHARAEQVHLYLGEKTDENELSLMIRDDGLGFDPTPDKPGMGLTNIHQRIRALDGRVTVESAPGEGTMVDIRIPLAQTLTISEDVMEVKTDHSLNKTFVAGLGGGLLTAVALIMPFFVSWQVRILAGEGLSLTAQDAIFIVIASLVVTTTGYMAVRWAGAATRGLGLMMGSFGGGTAVLIAYGVVLAPAAGIASVQSLWDWGFRPALDDPHALWLVAENAVNSIWYTNLTFWPTLLAGTALGALGGLFAPLREDIRTDAERRHVLGALMTMLSIVSASMLALSFFLFFLLESIISGRPNITSEPSIPDALGDYTLSLPSEGVLLVPFLSALMLCLITVTGWYLVRLKQVRAGDPVELRGDFTLSIYAVLISLGMGVFVLIRGVTAIPLFGLTIGLIEIGSAVVLLGLSGAFTALTVQDIRSRAESEPFFVGWNPMVSMWQILFVFVVLINIGVVVIGDIPTFVITILSLLLAGAMAFTAYHVWPNRRVIAVLAIGAAAGLVMMLATGWVWGFGIMTGLAIVVVLMSLVLDFNRRRIAGSDARLAQAHYRLKINEQGRQHHINSLGISIPVAGVAMSQVLPAALTLVMTIVVAIPALFAFETDPLPQNVLDIMEMPLDEIAQSLYFVHAQVMAGWLIGFGLLAGLVALAWRADTVVVKRRIARLENSVDIEVEAVAEAG